MSRNPIPAPSPSLRVSLILVVASALVGAFVSLLLPALAAVIFYLRRRTGPQRTFRFTRIDGIVLLVGAVAVVGGMVLDVEYRLTDHGLVPAGNPSDRLVLGSIGGALIAAFVLAALRRANR